ncbi:ergothioneine biosynthesis protein EgtB [Enterovirga rhinocerotis]|uniref:Ergothioneine biosynthesis protein EgtB n=1 Tax=Enterovirga rhinocerotis TaxID=1339210 RepID=A0A4R7C0J7_9HYPH|nr:ergothioneine biosynthesis protein EgtB [Enterovirga rhinocerotis]TDR90007.1 ergothioneine biosynthesis protein EgtB [Enterovirga rhinocerotis]
MLIDQNGEAPAGAGVASARVEARDVDWLSRYREVRGETERRASFLSPEDQQVQSMPDASPTKWHRAHVSWFFEQFLLGPRVPSYRTYDERFAFLFNSYYVAAGPRHARFARGLVTRPNADEVTRYRAHVDAAVDALLRGQSDDPEVAAIMEIGLNHEQQHQELMLTDILHAFAQNPTLPAYDPSWRPPAFARGSGWADLDKGIRRIGHDGDGFSFDNEGLAHDALILETRIAKALVTNREWQGFMEDRGYERAELWLVDGFATAQKEGWEAPGYWRRVDGRWMVMTLGGLKAVDPDAPVCHVSHYEADAFARWSGKVLPSEFEWEVAARAGDLDDAFGTVWQWTRSPYVAYPGYRPLEGTLGEYNGKFMANQMVLRGSSLATPDGHSRLTYRNFFYPQQRWQFTGLRLADDRS